MAMTHAWHDIVHDFQDEMHDLVTINKADVVRQAYLALWSTFVAVPLLFGIDRFAGIMNAEWDAFVAGWVNDVVPGGTGAVVALFGVIELALAVAVAALPRIGGDLLAVWLVLLSINMFSITGYAWIGVGTLALALCCLAMARMSRTYHHHEG